MRGAVRMTLDHKSTGTAATRLKTEKIANQDREKLIMFTDVGRARVSYFMIGVLSMLAIFLLTGISSNYPVGKYQMETVVRSNITQIYVIDTTTGRVKWVNKMNLSFDEMKDD